MSPIFLITLILVIQGFESDDNFDKKLDDLLSEIYRYGDTTRLMQEDQKGLKNMFEQYKTSMETETANLGSHYNGLALKTAQLILPMQTNLAKYALKTPEDNVKKIVQGINARVGKANKVRIAFLAAMTEAAKKDTATTFPILICYIKKFSEKMIAVYEDDKEIDTSIKGFNLLAINSISVLLEEEKGEGAESCQLPETTSNPSQFNSIYVPILKAIENLEKK